MVNKSINTDGMVELASAMWEKTALPLAITTTSGKFLRCNDAWVELFGYSKKELKKLNIKSIILEEDFYKYEKEASKLISGEIKSYRIKIKYIHKDGSITPASLYVNPIRSNGKVFYCISQADMLSKESVKEYLPAIGQFAEE